MSVKGTQGDSQRCWLLLGYYSGESLQSKLMIPPRFPQFPPSSLPHIFHGGVFHLAAFFPSPCSTWKSWLLLVPSRLGGIWCEGGSLGAPLQSVQQAWQKAPFHLPALGSAPSPGHDANPSHIRCAKEVRGASLCTVMTEHTPSCGVLLPFRNIWSHYCIP